MKLSRILGLAAVAGLVAIAAPNAPAAAASLLGPGLAAAVQQGPQQLTTEVRWRRHHWRRHYGWRRHHWRRHRW